ncbi:Arsenate reductase [bioreactor metagenome]|uniref:Arsenate reductase n=1 Tax=bioreactor metagenome TaxID=1076179 RepID=A0A645FLL8_9ZZZZ
MLKVLFVCVSNSARSQMAEAFLNKLGGGYFVAESAGIEPKPLNPLAIRLMAELGYDIRNNKVDSVFDFLKSGKTYSLVIKVCDQLSGQRCPVFPHVLKTLDWNIPDPALLEGTETEILHQGRLIRTEIEEKVKQLIADYGAYAKERNGSTIA